MTLTDTLAQIAFQHPELAAENLRQIGPRTSERVLLALLTVLRGSPDPDSALNLFERLTQCENQDFMRLFERKQALIHYAIAVFGHSHYLGETLIQNLDIFQSLSRDKNLERSHSREDFRESLARYRSRSVETNLSVLLARFKRREYVRIVLRDVLGIADLADTTAEISALSDVLLEDALREVDASMRSRYGAPQSLDPSGRLVEVPVSILSLGKLGGNELNYSSDVDVLFLFGDGEQPEAGGHSGDEISNREYFIRLAQAVTEVLSRITREGSVFRIDLRLRPQGNEGEPAIALTPALNYYAEAAHDWELQAMIKVRHSAGDLTLARAFIRGVQQQVYSQQLNFAAIETAIHSLEKISLRRRRDLALTPNPANIDVKLDRGGIRDIEFLVQCLQRVYGGKEKWLRSGGTMFSLQKLHDKEHISSKDYQELTSAYAFLRKLEHRLQLRRGQQVHRLPTDKEELAVLCASMAEREDESTPPSVFVEFLREQMARVAGIYARVIHSEQQHREQPDESGEFVLAPTPGFAGSMEPSPRQILERIAADSPELHAIASRSGLSPFAQRNLHLFLSSAMTTPDRYELLRRSPQALEHALQVFETSGYLSEVLARHPEIITGFQGMAGAAGVEGQASFLEFEGPTSSSEADGFLTYLASAEISYREKMDLLRQWYRQQFFESVARDVVHPRRVYESLTHTTQLTDNAIRAAASIAGHTSHFAVLALGRLGTGEFDWGSDADLLFVRSHDFDARPAALAAQRIVEVLSAYTRYGNLFAVDLRLRPHGGEGELVNTPDMLAAYFEQEAQAWEALTFTKLRFVAGSVAVADEALQSVKKAVERFAGDPSFVYSVRAMRTRLQKVDTSPTNFKTAAGGFYDIDFILSVFQVKNSIMPAAYNTRAQIRDLMDRSLLSTRDCKTLDRVAEFLRACDHAIRLVTGRSRKTLPQNEAARRAAADLTWKMLHRDVGADLQAELETCAAQVREIYNRVLG